MIEEKTIPLHELKYYHGESLGFVFTGVIPSSNDAIERLVNRLVSWKVSDKLPEFYTRPESNVVAFVYAGDSGFKQAAFYHACKQLDMTVNGIFEIDTLAAWLKTK